MANNRYCFKRSMRVQFLILLLFLCSSCAVCNFKGIVNKSQENIHVSYKIKNIKRDSTSFMALALENPLVYHFDTKLTDGIIIDSLEKIERKTRPGKFLKNLSKHYNPIEKNIEVVLKPGDAIVYAFQFVSGGVSYYLFFENIMEKAEFKILNDENEMLYDHKITINKYYNKAESANYYFYKGRK